MKKIVCILSILLGLFSLAGCDDTPKTKISYIDSKGEEKEVFVTPTDDKEIVQSVLEFSSVAQYEDVKGLSIHSISELYARFSDPLDVEVTKVNTKLETTFLANRTDGFEFQTSGSYSANQNQTAEGSVGVIYNGSLAHLGNKNQYLYADLSYKLNSPTEQMEYSTQMAFDSMEIKEELKDVVEEIKKEILYILLGQLPDDWLIEFATNWNGTEEDMLAFLLKYYNLTNLHNNGLSMKDFNTYFPNSSIEITDIKDNKIWLNFSFVYKDIISLFKIPANKIPLNSIQLNKEIEFSVAIDAKTAHLCEISIDLDDFSIFYYILLEFMDSDSFMAGGYYITLLNDFKFSTKITFEYDAVQIKTLTDSEKSKYKIERVS